MSDQAEQPRLFLIIPAQPDPVRFPALLCEALAAGDVAAVLVNGEAASGAADLAAALVPLIQGAGAAALVTDDTRLAGRLNADGIQIGSGLGDLRIAAESMKPKRIVGAGNVHSRHAAMEAGELDVDYLFFGRPHGDTHDEPHPKAVDLAAWWSELMEIPAVIMAGRSLDGIRRAASIAPGFVAVHDFVWSHGGGPGEAVRQAAAALAEPRQRAA